MPARIASAAAGACEWSAVETVTASICLSIALSISRESDDIQRTYELGVNSYIVKPVDFNSFTEVIKLIKLYWLQTNEPPFREIGHG